MFQERRLVLVGFTAELADFRLTSWVNVSHVGVEFCHVEKVAVALCAAERLIEDFSKKFSSRRGQFIIPMNCLEVFLEA